MLATYQPINDINYFVRGGAPIAAPMQNEREFYEENEKVAQALLNKQQPFEIKLKHNQYLMDIIMNNVKSIPDIQLPGLKLNTDSFTAEPIKYEKDDTKEIKQIIQKINKKIACHTCDHSKFEKYSIDYTNDIIKLRNSKNLQVVQKYINGIAESAILIHNADQNNRDSNVWDSIIGSCELKKAQKAAVDFASESLAIKSKYCMNHCTRCEKLQKEYQWSIDEIDRLRQEIKDEREEQIKRIQQEIDNPPILDFMNEYFKDKERVKLSDIAKLWKAVKRRFIKQDDIADMLEETEQWTISNSHNVRYANKKKE